MTFSDALEHIEQGNRLRRSGWDGKGMYIFLVKGSKFIVDRPPLNQFFGPGAEVVYQPHIDMYTADKTVVP